MNKVAHYLQQHLVGEVLTSSDVLDYFSTDNSIFQIRPSLVVHPKNENDLRKTARFTWQLAERGRVVPITIKGKGADQSGASLGSGIIMSTPAHLNRIIELDPKSGAVTAEVGVIAGKLQQTLFTHGRFLPSMTSAMEYETIGGAVGNNDSGPDSYKYGPIREFARAMRVVLANGELIKTHRLSKRELNKKLGLASFEGEVYRALDKLIEDSQELLASLRGKADRSNIGYAIDDVKLKDGSFDLTPLFVGSQGTLGLITEVTFDTEVHSPEKTLFVAICGSRERAWKAVGRINDMKDGPATLDFIDESLINYIHQTNPNLCSTTLGNQKPQTILFIEIEKDSARGSRKLRKKLLSILKEEEIEVVEPNIEAQDAWQVLRESASQYLLRNTHDTRPIPVIHDVIVPVTNAAAFIVHAQEMLKKAGQKEVAFWGQAGNGVIHTAPAFALSQVGDRQNLFKIMDMYYNLVIEAGGSVAGQSAEGRLKGSQAIKVFSTEQHELMKQIKHIFDPFGTLNPGVKIGVDAEALKQQVRSSYSLDHVHSYLPRS